MDPPVPGGDGGTAPPFFPPPVSGPVTTRPPTTSNPDLESEIEPISAGKAVSNPDGSATLTIGCPGPGTLSATGTSGSGASAKKLVVLASGKATAKKAGPVKLVLKPTPAGKKILKKKGKLSLTVKVTFKPKSGGSTTKTLKVKLKRKK
ncbi:MAG: hypothetical protein H0V29_02220 [Thermoleophilaceae bacterium]|nr:hypothetical protein [Thermoleophilaceae bacterium]